MQINKSTVNDDMYLINIYRKGLLQLSLASIWEQVHKVESFLKCLNNKFLELQKDFSKEVSSYVDELSSTAEIYDLAYNYISKTNKKFYLNPTFFMALKIVY